MVSDLISTGPFALSMSKAELLAAREMVSDPISTSIRRLFEQVIYFSEGQADLAPEKRTP